MSVIYSSKIVKVDLLFDMCFYISATFNNEVVFILCLCCTKLYSSCSSRWALLIVLVRIDLKECTFWFTLICYRWSIFFSLLSQEEAGRWKERGNRLSKDSNSVDLAIAYYTLALSFTASNEKDLKATILSNRSLMYKKTGRGDLALKDAELCVDNNPKWAKVSR